MYFMFAFGLLVWLFFLPIWITKKLLNLICSSGKLCSVSHPPNWGGLEELGAGHGLEWGWGCVTYLQRLSPLYFHFLMPGFAQ